MLKKEHVTSPFSPNGQTQKELIMTKICVLLVLFFGFNTEMFAAQHGGGHGHRHGGGGHHGGGAHFNAPRSAHRPSMNHSSVHMNAPRVAPRVMVHHAPRPSVHVNTPRPQTYSYRQPHYVPAPRPHYPPVRSYARPYNTNHFHGGYGGYSYGGYGVGLATSIVDSVLSQRYYSAPPRCVHGTTQVWSEEYGVWLCPTCGQPVPPPPTRVHYYEP